MHASAWQLGRLFSDRKLTIAIVRWEKESNCRFYVRECVITNNSLLACTSMTTQQCCKHDRSRAPGCGLIVKSQDSLFPSM